METFKYLERMLDRSDKDWTVVRRNVGKAHQVCSRTGKLLMREGTDPHVLAMFYWEVVQEVLIFGAETWVLLAAMYRNLEVVHVGFLRQITGHKEKRQRGGNWRSVVAAKVLKEAGTRSLGVYIEKRQAIVA